MQAVDSVLAEVDESPSQPTETSNGDDDSFTARTPTHKKLCRLAAPASRRRLSADNSTGQVQ